MSRWSCTAVVILGAVTRVGVYHVPNIWRLEPLHLISGYASRPAKIYRSMRFGASGSFFLFTRPTGARFAATRSRFTTKSAPTFRNMGRDPRHFGRRRVVSLGVCAAQPHPLPAPRRFSSKGGGCTEIRRLSRAGWSVRTCPFRDRPKRDDLLELPVADRRQPGSGRHSRRPRKP